MGAGEEDGPVDVVAVEALGASADVADVADVAISVVVLLNSSFSSHGDYKNTVKIRCWNSVNMTFCEEQRLMFLVWRGQRKVPTVRTEKTQPTPASAINVSQ